MVPLLGARTRLAAASGAALLVFVDLVSAQPSGWAHGQEAGELLGLLVFAMIATLDAGRVPAIDAYQWDSAFVSDHPKLLPFTG